MKKAELLTESKTMKHCPFCGAEAEIVVLDNGNFGVACMECSCNIGQYHDKQDAAKAWNTRYQQKRK